MAYETAEEALVRRCSGARAIREMLASGYGLARPKGGGMPTSGATGARAARGRVQQAASESAAQPATATPAGDDAGSGAPSALVAPWEGYEALVCDHHLSVTREQAGTLLSLDLERDGSYAVASLNLARAGMSGPVTVTIPALVDGRPVTSLDLFMTARTFGGRHGTHVAYDHSQTPAEARVALGGSASDPTSSEFAGDAEPDADVAAPAPKPRLVALVLPDTLVDVDQIRVVDRAMLWVCPGQTRTYHDLAEEGWKVCAHPLRVSDGTAYDLMDDGTATVVDLPVRDGTARVPASVEGHPVRTLGGYALGDARVARTSGAGAAAKAGAGDVTTVHVAEGVTRIMGHLVTPRLRELTLPSTLAWLGPQSFAGAHLARPVRIPAGCTHIGKSSLGSSACVFEATGDTVLLDPSFSASSFGNGTPPFDLVKYDHDLACSQDSRSKLEAMALRLASPHADRSRYADDFARYLKARPGELADLLVRTGSASTLRVALSCGAFADEAQLVGLTDRLAAAGQTHLVIELVEWRHEHFGHARPGTAASRFAL